MEEKVLITHSTDILTAKPVFIQIDCYPQNWWERLLVRCQLRPVQKVYELRPILVGNMYRIASVVNQLPADLMEGDLNTAIRQAVTQHVDKVIYVVAVGLQNNKKEPKKELLATIRNEFTALDMALVMEHIMAQLNLGSFLHSIVLAKGMNILTKTSPATKEEIIAPTTTPGS
jgi:hypothetical protein